MRIFQCSLHLYRIVHDSVVSALKHGRTSEFDYPRLVLCDLRKRLREDVERQVVGYAEDAEKRRLAAVKARRAELFDHAVLFKVDGDKVHILRDIPLETPDFFELEPLCIGVVDLEDRNVGIFIAE